MNKLKYFSTGFFTALLLMIVISSSLAFAYSNTVSAVISEIKIFMDNKEIVAKDSYGTLLKPLNYNGTVYLPVKPIAQAINKAVVYDSKNKIVYLGQNNTDIPATYLTSLTSFYNQGFTLGDSKYHTQDNVGNTYDPKRVLTHDYYGSHEIVYNLDGMYSRLTGTFFVTMEYKDKTAEKTLYIYADETLVYTGTIQKGVKPLDFDVDILNCNQLKIIMDAPGIGQKNGQGIANLALYP